MRSSQAEGGSPQSTEGGYSDPATDACVEGNPNDVTVAQEDDGSPSYKSGRPCALTTLLVAVSIVCLPTTGQSVFLEDRGEDGGLTAAVPEAHAMIAINWADQSRLYRHHSVFSRMPLAPLRVDPGFVTEHTGLKVPAEFDCANAFRRGLYGLPSDPIWFMPDMVKTLGRDYSQSTPEAEKVRGGYSAAREQWPALEGDYYSTVPSRWHSCHQLQSHILSGLKWFVPSFPVIDEEYVELASVYEMALDAKHTFSLVEIGARWGPWGFRSAAAIRRYNRDVHAVDLLFVEPEPSSCDAIRRVAQVNAFSSPEVNVSILCQSVTRDTLETVSSTLREWAAAKAWIDVLNLDCEGCEFVLIPAILDLLHAKVRRVILGIHNVSWSAQTIALRDSLRTWRPVHEAPMLGGGVQGPGGHGLRFCADLVRDQNKWQAQVDVEELCLGIGATGAASGPARSFGPTIDYDGALILDNPSFLLAQGAERAEGNGEEEEERQGRRAQGTGQRELLAAWRQRQKQAAADDGLRSERPW